MERRWRKLAQLGWGLMGWGLIAGLAGGCKEEPPPPPKPTPASTTGSAKAGASARAPKSRGAPFPRVSDATMKQYRIEACYYGSMGLTKARDAYRTSLGEAAPSVTKLPSFGTFESDLRPHPRMAIGAQLPFMRHVRSCSVAKGRTKPAYAQLDAALAEFEPYITKLNRLMVEANRYYQRKLFEKDDFKRGAELHQALTAEFAQLDDKLAAFDKVVRPWQDALPAPTDKLDNSGTIAVAALAAARKLVRALHEPKRDNTAVRTHYDAFSSEIGKLETRKTTAANEPHILNVLPKLLKMRAVVDTQMKDAGALTSDQSYALTSALTTVIDAHQRSVQQLLRGKGALKSSQPFRLMNPRLKTPTLRPQLKPKSANPANPK